jgi:hypothetical protein
MTMTITLADYIWEARQEVSANYGRTDLFGLCRVALGHPLFQARLARRTNCRDSWPKKPGRSAVALLLRAAPDRGPPTKHFEHSPLTLRYTS